MSAAKIYGQELGLLKSAVLLEEFIERVDLASGGPGATGAVPQRISATELQWSALAGVYLSDEDGNQLVDEDGNILYGPIE